MTDDQTSDFPDDTVVAAVSDGAYTLIVADFSDTDSAKDAYDQLRAAESSGALEIEGAIVVKHERDGKLEIVEATDHSTRSGLKWGVIGGIALGVVFPPSIIGSADMAGAAGTAVGKLRQLHHKSELEEELRNSIAAGHSGILALVSDPGAVKIREALSKADAIVERALDDVLAKDIKAAAKAAEAKD